MKLPVPRYIMNTCAELTPEWLGRRGILAVAADLDETLAGYGDALPPAAALQWAESLKRAGIPLGIVSNNTDLGRVSAHAAALGVPFVAPARKPRPDGLLRLSSMLGVSPSRMAMVGDQIFTDTLAALNAGMIPVRVCPLSRSLVVILRKPLEWPFLLSAAMRGND